MISLISAILGMILCSAVAGLYVSYRYEKSIRARQREKIKHLESEYRCVMADCIDQKLELARQEGIAIGRKCDAIQQQMIQDLSKDGRTVYLRSGQRRDA